MLVSLLTAVLEPPEPITEVRVLNPETSREAVQDKGAVLDVRVQLGDGRQINVEMQSQPHPGFLQRALFYWARLYTSQLGRGDPYQDLAPTVSVLVLNFNALATARYHTVFRLLEAQEHWPLTDDVSLHFVELPKLPAVRASQDGLALWKWGKFLKVRNRHDLSELAMSDPVFDEAKSALERLSADPAAQELAREREIWAWNHEMGLRLARKEGEARGQAAGEARGQAAGQARAVVAVLEARGLMLSTEEHVRILACTDLTQLDVWICRAATIVKTSDLFG